MKYLLLPALLLILTGVCCKNKKEEKEPAKQYISAWSLIHAQIKHVDTSLYSIMKIVTVDTLKPDTSYIPREQFSNEAKAFLEIPDLGNKKIAAKFREETPRYDEALNRVMITYLPYDSINEEYKSQELIITPNIATGDAVSSIIIKRVASNRDGFMQKNLLWVMNRSFQITTISQKPGENEKVTTTRVVWNQEKTWSEENKDLQHELDAAEKEK